MPAISGITKDASGVPCQALVRAYRRSDGKFIGEAVSNASTGAYSISTLDTSPHIVQRIFGAVTEGYANNLQRIAALHLTGTNGATTFPEVSGITTTQYGSTAISNAQTLFGGNSAYFNGSSGITLASLVAIGTQDFTARCWVYPTATSTYESLFFSGGSNTVGSMWLNTQGSIIQVNTHESGGNGGASTTRPAMNQWSFVEAVRKDGAMKISVSGVFGSSATRATSITVANPMIGTNPDEANMSWRGYVREFEIFVGVALHFDNFTPPTASFLDSPTTVGEPTENAQIFDYVIPV